MLSDNRNLNALVLSVTQHWRTSGIIQAATVLHNVVVVISALTVLQTQPNLV
uniref:Uncharacterized protein n=1 Tax=Arundo donax TaxID=35708 RepID=A0A0A8Y093_ARUDO